MAVKRVKKQEHEKLTDSNIEHVISLLEAEKPITKKVACEILNISYNTARLTSIIEDYKDRKETLARRKAEKRGKPISQDERATIISGFLSGDSISDISMRVFRSTGLVKAVIEEAGVPEREQGEDRYKTTLLPDKCISEEFKVGEVVWSAKYHTSCEIMAILPEKYLAMYGVPCYRVWINEPSEEIGGGFYAMAPAYDLGKLTHLEEIGVKLWNI
jgi:hypothetical protein